MNWFEKLIDWPWGRNHPALNGATFGLCFIVVVNIIAFLVGGPT